MGGGEKSNNLWRWSYFLHFTYFTLTDATPPQMSRNKKEAERRNGECIPTSEDKWSINMDKDNLIQKSERHKSRSKRINVVVSGGGK